MSPPPTTSDDARLITASRSKQNSNLSAYEQILRVLLNCNMRLGSAGACGDFPRGLYPQIRSAEGIVSFAAELRGSYGKASWTPMLSAAGVKEGDVTPADEVVGVERVGLVEHVDGETGVQEQRLHEHPRRVSDHRVVDDGSQSLAHPVLHRSQTMTNWKLYYHHTHVDELTEIKAGYIVVYTMFCLVFSSFIKCVRLFCIFRVLSFGCSGLVVSISLQLERLVSEMT